MGKALKTVGMVVGAAALVATGAGAILMPGVAGTTTLFGVSVGTLNTVSAGLVAVGGMLDKPQSAGSGSADEWTSNPDQPTPFAFGRVGCSGKIVHRDEYGPDNRLQGIVSVYSGAGPIKAFVGYKVDGVSVTFASNGGTANGKYNRQMWRSWRLGAQPDTALSLPTGLDGGAVMPAWGAAYKLSGKACELLTVQQDSKFSVYPTGLPTPQATIEGIFGYDPRYDSTYPGGFGDCRLGVRSTYRWINNPIIGGLNWALGMVENGKVVGGIGASPQGIDIPAFVEAANVADANAWTVTAWPDTSEDVSEVLKQFLQAGGASYARHAGKISCVSRGAAKPSIVTVTGRDTCGPIELDTGSSLFNRINTITPSFMSEAHGWKHVPADPVTFESLRTEDGGKRGDQITYRFVGNAQQAAQLAAYDILDAREPFSGTVPFKPHLRRLKRGDCFVLSEPGFLLDGVKCMVLGRTYNAQTGEVRVAFRSETDGKHPLALGKSTTMPDYPELAPADPTLVSPPLPNDWTIEPRPPGEGGVQVPIIDIIGEVSNGTATAVHFEWWVVPVGVDPYDTPPLDAVWQSAGIWPPTVTSIPVQANPGASIWIGVSYLRGENFSERALYGPIVVPGLISDDTTHLKGEPVQNILDRLVGVEAISASNQTAVSDLEEVYGDTVSAAQSAAEAATSQADAAAKAALAQNHAEDASASAVAAQTAKDAAQGAAAAAASSASTATTKADEASSSATAATAAKTAAETARGQAQTAATNASTSATNAAGSASSASTSASNAATSRDQASGFATAASGSASTASTKATEAGNSATAANASKVAAESARDGAAGSAAAAVTSASTASTKATEAGNSASAAQGAATTAATQAGNAQTFRNQAASSASDAQSAASSAGTSAGAANASAATAVQAAATATDKASEASLSANIAASAGSGAINSNALFTDYPTGSAIPPSWATWGNPTGGTYNRQPAARGAGFVPEIVANGTAEIGLMQSPIPAPADGGFYVLEADVQRRGGSFVGSFIEVQGRNASNAIVSSAIINIRNTIGTAGVIGTVYPIRKLLDLRGAGHSQYQIYFKARNFSPQPDALTIRPEKVVLRPATEAEIAAGTVLPDVQAQLAITAAVAADSQSRLGSVSFDVTGGAGGDPFDVSLKAGPNGSDASITATKIRLRNVVNGQVVDALTVEGGKAKFSGELAVQSGISGERTVITTNAVRVFDAGNVERVTLGRW